MNPTRRLLSPTASCKHNPMMCRTHLYLFTFFHKEPAPPRGILVVPELVVVIVISSSYRHIVLIIVSVLVLVVCVCVCVCLLTKYVIMF